MSEQGGKKASSELEVGTRLFDRFDLVDEAWRSAEGDRFVALDERGPQNLVFIHTIPTRIADDSGRLQELTKQCKSSRELVHQNIGKIVLLNVQNKPPFLVLEFFEGRSLSSTLQSGETIALSRVVDTAKSVATALDEAASHGLIHGDIHPGNILDRDRGASHLVKVAGFGFSRLLRQSLEGVAANDEAYDRLHYIAPEDLAAGVCTKASDQYSLAATVYRLLSGKAPFIHYQGDLSEAILKEVPPPIEGQPDHINATLARALSKEPEHRFPDCETFCRALDDPSLVAEFEVQEKEKEAAPLIDESNGATEGPGAVQNVMRLGGALKWVKRVAGVAVVAAILCFAAPVLSEYVSVFSSAEQRPVYRKKKIQGKSSKLAKKKLVKKGKKLKLAKKSNKPKIVKEKVVKVAQAKKTKDKKEIKAAKAPVQLAKVEKVSVSAKGAKSPSKAEKNPEKSPPKEVEKQVVTPKSKAEKKELIPKAPAVEFAAKKEEPKAVAIAKVKKEVLIKELPKVEKEEPNFTVKHIVPKSVVRRNVVQRTVGNHGALSFVNALGMKMVWVAPGTFWMGSDQYSENQEANERPRHQRAIKRGFWLGSCEVTQEQFNAVMGHNPSQFRGRKRPVDSVTWQEALAFCRAMTLRERKLGTLPDGHVYALPSEAQWEYASRAASSEYARRGLAKAAWYKGNSKGMTRSVGRKKANKLGLYDMFGNVEEWCLDRRSSDYSHAPHDESPNLDDYDERCIQRGGSWAYDRTFCRAAYRGYASPSLRSATSGFRCAIISKSLLRQGSGKRRHIAGGFIGLHRWMGVKAAKGGRSTSTPAKELSTALGTAN